MAFDHFKFATSVVRLETQYFEWVNAWHDKRERLLIQLTELPDLEEHVKSAFKTEYSNDKRITLVDDLPRIRLATACEGVSNTLYGMSEIAARFANRVSGAIPRGFSKIRRKHKEGGLDKELSVCLGDLHWYEKVRELRTEWAHYSSVYVGEDHNEGVLLIASGFRGEEDRQQFKGRVEFTVSNIVEWTENAVATLDRLADYLLVKYVLPKFNPSEQMLVPKRDDNGMIMLRADGSIDAETCSIRDYFARKGISFEVQ